MRCCTRPYYEHCYSGPAMTTKLRVLDLFSGIGGFSLGLERTGYYDTVAFCEINKKAQQVLRKHWPDVPIFDDVTKLTKFDIKEKIDVITGGFPCQDISVAGTGKGLTGNRSGLWFEYHRLINEFKPQFAIIENSPALRSRGLDQVLRGLYEIGYDAEWHCIPASAIGAPHKRDRIWIVAYPIGYRWTQDDEKVEGEIPKQSKRRRTQPSSDVPYAHSTRLQRGCQNRIFDTIRREESSDGRSAKCSPGWERGRNGKWTTEPNVGRVVNGVPGRVDRLKQLGNAVVPDIPEIIGETLFEELL